MVEAVCVGGLSVEIGVLGEVVFGFWSVGYAVMMRAMLSLFNLRDAYIAARKEE
jgi:hypothetical protein